MTYNVPSGTLNTTIPFQVTWLLLVQHFRSLGLLCPTAWNLLLYSLCDPALSSKDESILSLPFSTHSAVKWLHDSALYKSIIDTDSDIDNIWLRTAVRTSEVLTCKADCCVCRMISRLRNCLWQELRRSWNWMKTWRCC